MPYVSAKYAPPNPTIPSMPGAPKRVIATDDQGTEWWLTDDSQVGDWLRYIESGGTIDPAEEPLAPEQPALPERDYGAEIDALDARVTALEEKS